MTNFGHRAAGSVLFRRGKYMASQEGAHRIKTVGKFIILIGCTIAVITLLIIFNTRSVELLWLASLLITPVAFGGFVYALGWILEGYSRPPHRED